MNRTQKTFTLILVPALVAVAGCATNTLRIQAATSVAEKGKITSGAAREFLDQVERTRYRLNVDFIAADPACGEERATTRRRLNLRAVTNPLRPPRGWLCESLPQGAENQGLMMRPIADELRPTVKLIDTLAAYSSALSDILGAPADNPVEDINNVLETARAAQGLFSAVARQPVRLVPAADDARLTALENFIGFVSELSNEADRVAQLRQLRDRGIGGTALIEALKNHLDAWEIARREDERAGVYLSTALLNASVHANPLLTAAQRREFAQDYYDRVRAESSSGKIADAVNVALQTLSQAETDYQELLREHPHLNARQREQRAEIIRQRVTRGLGIATAIVTSFLGA